jgi:nucleoside-diphosphate-sugar epimerase
MLVKMDISRADKVFDWLPLSTLVQGITKTAAWLNNIASDDKI